jgi:hypothetical protein
MSSKEHMRRTYEDKHGIVHALLNVGRNSHMLVCTQSWLTRLHKISRRDKVVTCLTCIAEE